LKAYYEARHVIFCNNARRVEQLCISELSHLRDFTMMKTPGGTETFLGEEEVFRQTIDRWTRFIKQEPYDETGLLKRKWEQKLAKLPTAPSGELGRDYSVRHRRWLRFVGQTWGEWVMDRIYVVGLWGIGGIFVRLTFCWSQSYFF
jgi:hypothetical protein